LTDESLLANGLSHSLRPCQLRRCVCRRYAGTCAAFIPCLGGGRQGLGWRSHRSRRAPLVRRDSFHRYVSVSRPSQPPCDTRHEEAPAAYSPGLRFSLRQLRRRARLPLWRSVPPSRC
jgi:hypothetical protein